MLQARQYFEIDKSRGKLICKVVMSGDKSLGNARYCNAELAYNNNTSAMNGHLKAHHKNIQFKTKNTKNINAPNVIKNSLLNANSYDFDTEKYKTISEHIIQFIAETNQPLSIVDEPSFIKLLSKLESKYKTPGRQTVTNKYLNETFEKIKLNIKEELSKSEFVSVTLDGWSSVANDAYLGFTCHFINDDFEMISRLLALKHVPERHTADYLSNQVTSIVNKWEIETKIINATIDGAYNINQLSILRHF